MINPKDFYISNKANLEKEASILKRKLINLGIFRFAVFFGTSVLIYFNFGHYPDVFIIAFLGFLLFSIFVVKFINLKREKAIIDAKIKINKTEIKVLNRDFHHLKDGKEFINPTHFYSNDIDLFGVGSFFQYVNRTSTIDGKATLANIFTENKIERIVEKQNAINELSEKVKWRQHFSALANLVKVKNKTGLISNWILNYKSVFPSFLSTLQIIFSAISIALISLISF